MTMSGGELSTSLASTPLASIAPSVQVALSRSVLLLVVTIERSEANGSAARAAEVSVDSWVPPAANTCSALVSPSGVPVVGSLEEVGSAAPVSGTTVVTAARAPSTATRGSQRRAAVLSLAARLGGSGSVAVRAAVCSGSSGAEPATLASSGGALALAAPGGASVRAASGGASARAASGGASARAAPAGSAALVAEVSLAAPPSMACCALRRASAARSRSRIWRRVNGAAPLDGAASPAEVALTGLLAVLPVSALALLPVRAVPDD